MCEGNGVYRSDTTTCNFYGVRSQTLTVAPGLPPVGMDWYDAQSYRLMAEPPAAAIFSFADALKAWAET